MPPPPTSPGFQLQTGPSRPPAPSPGFELERSAARPPPTSPGFTLAAAPAAPPPTTPGFELVDPAQLNPGDPGWIDVPEEPPIGFGEVLADSLGQTASEWGRVFGGLPEKVSASMAKMVADMKAAEFAELERANAAVAALPADSWRRRLTGLEGTPEEAAELKDLTETERAIAQAAAVDLQPTKDATMLQQAVEQAAISGPPSAAAMAVGLTTRNPTLAAASMYPSASASGFGEALDELDARAAQQELETLVPRSAEQRLADLALAQETGARSGVLESVSEINPMSKVLKIGSPLVKTLTDLILAELPGEAFAEISQEINKQISLAPDGEPELDTIFRALEESGKRLPQTALATIVGSISQSAPMMAASAIDARLNRKPQETPPAGPPDGAPEAEPVDVDVEARARAAFGDELGPQPAAEAAPLEAKAPEARTPSDQWRADPAAGEGVPFAFLGESPESAAGFLIENGDKIQAVTAAGDVVGEFDGPDQAAIALEDAIGAAPAQTSAQPAAPAQGFGDELAELGGAPVPKEPVQGEIVTPAFQTAGPAPTNLQPGSAVSAPQQGELAVDRRANRRKSTAEMSPDELRQALTTHELTGIANRRAYEEAPKLPSQTAVDVDSLKWVNDEMGHDSGNELLKAVGEAIRAETDQAYHLSGDEFAIQTATPEEAAAIMQRVNERLAGTVISVTMPSGEVVTLSGMGVSYGSGKDLGAADAALQAHKTERQARGERAGRGEQPPGASRFPAEAGRQDNEGRAPTEEERQTGEHITLAGPFAHREAAQPEELELDGGGPQDLDETDVDRQLGDDLELATGRGAPPKRDSLFDREVAVQRMLGGAKNAPTYRFVHAQDLPADVQQRMSLAPGYVWKAAFDPTTNKVWLNQDEIGTAAEAAWYSMHEIAGHYGIKGAIGQLGATDRTRINAALKLVAQNKFIADLAAVYQEGRNLTYGQALEEALSELAAAIRTGNFARLERAYGLPVPGVHKGELPKTGPKPSWQRAFDRFVETLKRLFNKALGYNVSDEQIHAFLEDAWQYVQTGKKRTPAERKRGDREVSLSDEIDENEKDVEKILNSDVTPAKAAFEGPIATVIGLVDRIRAKDISEEFGEAMQRDLHEAAILNLEKLLEDYAKRFGQDYDGPNAERAIEILREDDEAIARRAADAGYKQLKPGKLKRPSAQVFAIELRAVRGKAEIKHRLLDEGPWETKEEAQKFLDNEVDDALRGRVVPIKRFEFEQTISDQYEAEKPDGEPPDLASEEQLNSEAFKRWFGDSVVVDKDGKPQVMYHFTQADVKGFRPWSHFGSMLAARDRGNTVRRFDEVVGRTERVGASRTMAVYLAIENPLRMRDMAAQEIEDDSDTAQRDVYTRAWELPEDVAESLLEMGEINIDEFEKVQGSHDKIAKLLQSKGYDGIVYENMVEGVYPEDGTGDDSYIVFEPTQVKSAIGNRGTFDPTDPDVVNEPPVAVRRAGPGSMRKYGLGEGRNTTRQVAAALEKRQRDLHGKIEPNDYTPKTRRRIARWMAAEIAHELEHPKRSGVGWYGAKFKRALNVLATEFPELAKEKSRRDLMTALIAITSSGVAVKDNLNRAIEIYRGYRETGKLKVGRSMHDVAPQLASLGRLIEAFKGLRGAQRFLMKELTVSELKKRAAEAGVEFNVEVQADQRMPMAALVFGPKLGAFYANLMGADGYLTMDRWWSRSFNRYRGQLLTKPNKTGLERFRQLIGKPNLSEVATIEATIAPAIAYAEKGFKNGTEIEKAANTLYKAAFINLEDTPRNARDRTFMLETAKEAQAELKRRGHEVSIADMQAILWYYEKRLYGELGATQSKVVSYEDAARQLFGQERRGSRDRRRRPGLGEDAGAAPARDADQALPGDEDGDAGDRVSEKVDVDFEPRERKGPRRSARTSEPEQGELFTKADARPGTNAKQLALSNELLREWSEKARRGSRKIKTLAAAFDNKFRTDHTASLLGHVLNDPEQFALLAQTFRDPRYETLRYFFTDKDGKVIAETGVSARLPGGAAAWPAGSTQQWLVDMFKRVGATGIRLLHNHPSGNSAWSEADMAITRKIAALLRVPIDHVILDSNEYSVIKVAADGSSERGSEARVPLEGLGPDKLKKPIGDKALHKYLGFSIMSPRDLVAIAQQLKRPEGHLTVIGLSQRHHVRVIGDLKEGATKTKRQLENALRAFGIQNGAPALVIAGVDPAVWNRGARAYAMLIHDGYLLDVIDTDGRSLAATYNVYKGGRTLGKLEQLDTVEVGSAYPFGHASAKTPDQAERRKQPDAVAEKNKAQRELDLEQAQRDLEEQINPRTTETAAFKRWFGKSKVVDEKGRPLVVYHGTAARTDFDAFQETTDVGFHFGTAKAAADRLGLYPETKRQPQIKHARVIPVYLSIQNPLRMDDLSDWEGGEVIRELERLGVITIPEGEELHRKMRDVADGDIAHLDNQLFRELLEKKGYDGVVYKNETEGIELKPFAFTRDEVTVKHEPKLAQPYVAYGPDGKRLIASQTRVGLHERLEDLFKHGDTVESDSWIALRPTQIKSAIGNRGTFSHEDERIQLASEKGGPPKKSGFSGGPGRRYVEMYRYKGTPGAPTRAKLREGELEIPKEPIRAQHVMELFQRLFKVKIYEGKPFKVRSALGFFRPKNFEVRNKYRNDLEVAAHEVFHWLDRTYPTIRKLYHQKRFADELKGVSYDETKLYEGFAEFGRLFMTQEPEAIERLPTFYEAFVKEARDAGILDKLEEVQRLMHQWYLQGAEARGRSKIGSGGIPIKQRIGKMVDGFVDRAIASALDNRQAAKVIEREVLGKEAFGDAALSPYKSIRLLGGVRSTINTWLNYGTLRWTDRGDLERNGPGLKQIFEPIASVFDEAMGYFVAMRANELRIHGKENLFTKDETDALIERARKTGKLEQIQRAHAAYQQYTKRLLHFAVQSGILSAETKAVWEELYANYVPFYRVAEKFGTLDPRMAGGTQGGLFRKLTGGTANVADIFENITLNTALVVHAAMKNVAMRQLFAAIESSPLGQRYAVRIGDDTEMRKVGIDQVTRVLNEFAKAAADRYHETPEADTATRMEYGQLASLAWRLTKRDPDKGQLTMGDVMQQAKFFFTGRPPQIPDKQMVLIRGEPRWYQIGDPLLWDMLTDMNYHQPLGLAEKVFGIAKRTLTRGVTITPEFQIANMLRDTFNAFALSKSGQMPIVDALKAIVDIWKESPAYVDFLANGGGFGNATGDEARKLRVRIHASGHRWLSTPAELLEFWDKWGQSFELATRLAEYKGSVRQGTTKREAAFRGREISTDFAMRGHSALARWASISVSFFNARLQGLYRVEREINERNGRQSVLRGERALAYASKAFMGLTVPALLIYWFLNRGDDDYEELGEELKSLNTVIPGPDGTVVLIPRPFETGALFMEVPVRLLQYAEEQNGEQLVDAMMFMLANTFNFNPTPQLAQPPLRIMMNQQWNGLPVVPRSLENVEPREQFQPWTPDTYKRIGEQFDVSPLKLQALVEGYLGTVGTYGVAASDALMQPPDAEGEEVDRRLSQWPLLRRFMREAPYTNTSFESRFYEMLDEVDRVVDTARKLRREAREDDLDAYLTDDERAALFAISKPATDTMELAADLNAQMRAIRSDPELDGEEKLRQVLELQEEQNALFREAMTAFDEAMLEEARKALEQGP